MSFEINEVQLSGVPSSALFDSVAEETAIMIKQSSDRNNNSTQLRRFYDELEGWNQKVKENPEAFDEFLPLIKMLNAKVAYARGRSLVSAKFSELFSHCIRQINDKESLNNCKLFLEAFLGFYKVHNNR